MAQANMPLPTIDGVIVDRGQRQFFGYSASRSDRRHDMKTLWLALALGAANLAVSAGPGPASTRREVATISLASLVEMSDVIGVGMVVGEFDGVATFEMLHAWKGADGFDSRTTFRATPTWTCDTSTAVMGEVSVMFLKAKGADDEGAHEYAIAHSGRGRMPLSPDAGKARVVFQDIAMPVIMGSMRCAEESKTPWQFTADLVALRAQVVLAMHRAAETDAR